MLNIKNLNDLIDFIESHKRGHRIWASKVTTFSGESWTFWIDNKKTQKRKTVTIKLDKDGNIYGSYNILKGYDNKNESWGHKRHVDPTHLELSDAGHFRFTQFIENSFNCVRADTAGSFFFADYTFKKRLAL